MRSRIYEGEVMHARLEPARHVFRYPALFYAFDLDELEQLGGVSALLGYNRRRVVSLWDQDYLHGEGSIRQRVGRVLAERGLDQGVARIELITSARYFGHAFNPVSFYHAYGTDGQLRAVVAEVNNTFGDRHLYVLDQPSPPRTGFVARYETAKQMHVSPFNDLRGGYTFDFSAAEPRLDIRIDLHREGRELIKTRLHGEARPLTAANLRRALLRHPLNVLLTLPRIHIQAGHLYFRRHLRIFGRPTPRSDHTMQAKAAQIHQRIAQRLVLPHLDHIRTGHLKLVLPDRSERSFGAPGTAPAVTVRLRDYQFFWRVLRDGEIGFGESYMHGEWDASDLTQLIELFLANRHVFEAQEAKQAWYGRLANRLLHRRRANTVEGSRRNIAAHYDLSNDFYRLFLDPSMMYSCALWRRPEESLEEAQRNKLHALIEKAGIAADHHVLEIGSGWGAFAIEAVRRTGCRVTTLTISQQQHDLAVERIREAGLADRIEVRLCDYRDVQGQFDRVVSIEMLEAVGHEYLGEYFAILDRVLKPGGRVALQVITMPDQRYEAYRQGVDWIQKHIFPGGHLPSLGAIQAAVAARSRLAVSGLENIGTHYVRTLQEWRRRFTAARAHVQQLGFDETFARKWHYYLCYCEAAFATRAIDTVHIVLDDRRTNGAAGA